MRDPINNTLDCAGLRRAARFNPAAKRRRVQGVLSLRRCRHAAAASGVTNAAPFGGSILDAAAVNNALAGAIDPWNYVVAVMVCITLQTDEIGVGTSAVNTTATRCPSQRCRSGSRGWVWSLRTRPAPSAARFRRSSPYAIVPPSPSITELAMNKPVNCPLLTSHSARTPHDRRRAAGRAGRVDRLTGLVVTRSAAPPSTNGWRPILERAFNWTVQFKPCFAGAKRVSRWHRRQPPGDGAHHAGASGVGSGFRQLDEHRQRARFRGWRHLAAGSEPDPSCVIEECNL